MADAKAPGRFRRTWRRLGSTDSELEAQELRATSHEAGATAVCDCEPGQVSSVLGTLRSVTLRPRSGVPALEAELYDGSGQITLVWMGRRQIAGIEPGRMLVATGRVNRTGGRSTMYNPRYVLRPLRPSA